ncbi:glycosyltransferase family A protein [Microbacterium sp. NPDC055683]
MLAFITSLRHPQNSADYRRVEELLRLTLASTANQTSDDYVVIVVGNVRPSFELPPRVHFVPVDFPAPAPATGPRTDRAPFVWDKGTKIGIGLAAAREHSPDHVMIFDADDFVHRDLAAFLSGRKDDRGWVVDRGWMYSRARNAYRAQNAFNRICGTCHILPYSAYGIPDDLTVTSTQEQVAEAFGERLEAMLGAHHGAVEWHAARGRTLHAIPFRAAVYHVDTGENHSGKAMTGVARPYGRALRRDFAIDASLGAGATWWSALRPAAIAQSVSDSTYRNRRRAARFARRVLVRA